MASTQSAEKVLPESVLEELHVAAPAWRDSACGTDAAVEAEFPARSQWLSTSQAADLLGVTSRTVRKSIALDRLHATSHPIERPTVLTILAILRGSVLVAAAMRAFDRMISRGLQPAHAVLLNDGLD